MICDGVYVIFVVVVVGGGGVVRFSFVAVVVFGVLS